MQTLARGQKLKLSDLTSSSQLRVGLSAAASGLKFDCSCFGVDANGQLSDDRYFIFFNQPQSPEGALRSIGAQSGDDASFEVDLSRLPTTIQKLVFVITIDGNGTMSQLSRGHLRLTVGNDEVARFEFGGSDFGVEKAIMAGEIYRKDIWRVAAVGQGFSGGLNAVLKHFGGEEIEASAPPAPVPTPAPPVSAPPTPAPPAPAAAPVNLGKVTLEKKGDKQSVNLQKGGGTQPIHINLNWDNPNAGKRGFLGITPPAPDLDLGCMYRLRDGQAGVIQPLGKIFGARDRPPFIFLDKDDRSGAASDGENLYIYRPDLIELVMVFAMIYEGASDFTQVGGRLVLKDQSGSEILVRLSSPDRARNFCAICTIANVGSRIDITKEEQYFPGHREADQRYGFGFNWKAGSK